LPVELQQDHDHAVQERNRREDGEDPVHRQGLDGAGVGREAVEEVPHLTPAVEGEREVLEMGV
jgi:hypothetical protein